MKGTEHFRDTIKAYLDKKAAEDQQFAATYAKENKNIDDCINYILDQVQKSGCNGFADEEIFGMAIHYYDEDNKTTPKFNSSVTCVVNHHVELTDEEKKKLRDKAAKQYTKDCISEMKAKAAAKRKKPQPDTQQPTLFDL